jgi:hypothetical protein
MNATKLRVHTLKELMELACAGLNPYKLVEIWENCCPHVDHIYWDNVLYCKPDDKVLMLVKAEKSKQAVF